MLPFKILGGAKNDLDQFKRVFEEGLLNDNVAFFLHFLLQKSYT